MLNLCMLSGSFEYDSETSLNIFKSFVEKNYPIQANLIVYDSEDDDPSLSVLDDADVLLVFTRRLNTAGKSLRQFQTYCEQGRPLVGVRTASHAYQNWLEFDKTVLGGDYQGHYGHGPTVQLETVATEHPILNGIPKFESYGSLYKNPLLRDDTSVLLMGHTDEHSEPVAWTRLHNDGRICYTSLGHQKDFELEPFLRFLAQSILWVSKQI
ncbi:MAG: ThuA domain-containing protein [Candidatus Poribacteria bacterium]|nr:ThuA domain-containing protein [Candidatus Poribacteria bacterium]